MTQLLQIPPSAPQPTAEPSEGLGSFWERLAKGTRRFEIRADWDELAGEDWRTRILDMPVTDDFHEKQGRSTGRWIRDRDRRRFAVYLKRHYRSPWWAGWLATFFPRGLWSFGMRERCNLLQAASFGVPVPKVVAAGEWIGPRGQLRSFLAIEELTGMLPSNQAIPMAAARLTAADFRRWKHGLIAEMARVARLLHDHRYFHKDLYLCHFFIPEADTTHVPTNWANRVHLIDFHRLQRHAWTWPIWLVKDLGSLLYSSDVDGVTPRDRWQFWRAYRQTRPHSWRARCVAWWIRFKAERYRKHNAKKQDPGSSS